MALTVTFTATVTVTVTTYHTNHVVKGILYSLVVVVVVVVGGTFARKRRPNGLGPDIV